MQNGWTTFTVAKPSNVRVGDDQHPFTPHPSTNTPRCNTQMTSFVTSFSGDVDPCCRNWLGASKTPLKGPSHGLTWVVVQGYDALSGVVGDWGNSDALGVSGSLLE